jgi:hypothetical protein
LLRAVVRQEQVGAWPVPPLEVPAALAGAVGVTGQHWASSSVLATDTGDGGLRLAVRPWAPAWLPGAADNPPDDALYEDRPRRRDPTLPADPMVRRLVGYSSYQSEAQREALAAVLAAPHDRHGAVVVVDLPTGAGKSLCGLLPALCPLGDGLPGVTPFVVPTVALALDLERRAARPDESDYRAAYRPEEPSALNVRLRCERGLQGPVFVSPESLAGSLRPALTTAAGAGLLRAFVVDEAHMVSTWGDEFRPAFQQIAAVRRELLDLACRNGHAAFVTILLSATLTEPRLQNLRDLFGGGPLRFVHAVRLRPEPVWHVAEAPCEEERHAWVLDAVRHLPRPLILYAVKRFHAERWHCRLREAGFRRVGLMTGASDAGERRRVLAAWGRDELDVVVATSAFGLGVDKQDVRAVLHVALPEGVDRLYQEVGRGGRDGFASLALLIWGKWDWATAQRLLSPTFIGPERGLQRWAALFRGAVAADPAQGLFRVPLNARPSLRPGDINMDNEENEKWNLRTLLLMARAGALELDWNAPAPDGVVREDEDALPDTVTVRVRVADHLEEAFWQREVEPCRRRALGPARPAVGLLRRLLTRGECVADVLADCYRSRDPAVPVVRACGGCPYCRTHDRPPHAGGLRSRRTPDEPWPTLPFGPRLRDFLGASQAGVVFYPACDGEVAREGIAELLGWLVDQEALILAVPQGWGDRVEALLAARPHSAVFLEDHPARGILARQATGALIDGPGPPRLEEFHPLLYGPAGPLLLLVPDDAHEPGRPDRLLRDMWPGPSLTLDGWKERYLE